MQSYKPCLEEMISKIYERCDDGSGQAHPPGGHVNRLITQLAAKYGNECKNTFDDLSNTVQRVRTCVWKLFSEDSTSLLHCSPIVNVFLICSRFPQ